MAARRLVMVLFVLLVVSTLAAALVPPPDEEPEETSTPTRTTEHKPTNKLVRATVAADVKKPERVSLRLGSELQLRVTSERFEEVEIPTLGEFDEVDRFAPAIFDLLPEEEGTYPVRIVEGNRLIARIVVSGCCRTS
jgi:hypothetical protein